MYILPLCLIELAYSGTQHGYDVCRPGRATIHECKLRGGTGGSASADP